MRTVDGVDLEPTLRRLWPERTGAAQLTTLRAEASTRRYYRVRLEGATPASAIVMQLPKDALPTAGEELTFLDVRRHLARQGLRVPAVLVDDLTRGLLLLEDFGDQTLEARLQGIPRGQWQPLYAQAVDLLVAMQRSCASPADDCVAYRRQFDRELFRWELEHFREWGLEALGHELSSAERARMDASFDELADALAALSRGFAHRDFQSRNLMCLPDGSLGLLDFQDALQAPAAYDLVALLCDSYVPLEPELQQAMLARYLERQGLAGEAADALVRSFWQLAVQRKLKDAGRFVFIDRVRHNPGFLPSYAQSLRYVGRALQALGITELSELLAAKIPGFPDAVPCPESAHIDATPG